MRGQIPSLSAPWPTPRGKFHDYLCIPIPHLRPHGLKRPSQGDVGGDLARVEPRVHCGSVHQSPEPSKWGAAADLHPCGESGREVGWRDSLEIGQSNSLTIQMGKPWLRKEKASQLPEPSAYLGGPLLPRSRCLP